MNNIILLFLTVPVITALIGWLTNWAAVKMIFHPVKFIGIGPIGWQAVVIKQSEKLATGIAEMATDNLITTEELLQRVDPEVMKERLKPVVDAHLPRVAEEVGSIVMPGAWQALPDQVKTMALAQVDARTGSMGADMLAMFAEEADDLIDLHQLVIRNLSGDKAMVLSELTKKIGKNEFKFIEYYGAIFGFVIGLAQVGAWAVMQTWWLMPIVGLIVGLVTNWLAIQMIFRPQEPTKYLGLFTYQGLFPKRQAEIAADYGESAATELLTPKNFIDLILEGKSGERLKTLFSKAVRRKLDEEVGRLGPNSPLAAAANKSDAIATSIETNVLTIAKEARPQIEDYLAEAFDIETTVRERLTSMPKDKFERILRGVFEEDEITLIVVGGVLGLAVGFIQAAVVLAL